MRSETRANYSDLKERVRYEPGEWCHKPRTRYADGSETPSQDTHFYGKTSHREQGPRGYVGHHGPVSGAGLEEPCHHGHGDKGTTGGKSPRAGAIRIPFHPDSAPTQ